LLLVSLVAALIAHLTSGVQGQELCPDPAAELQLILQRESVFWTPEPFAGQVREPELVVEPGVFHLYVGIVSQLPAAGSGVYGWNVFVQVTGDLYILEGDVLGTVAARTGDEPPGLVEDGFGVVHLFDREPYGRFALGTAQFSVQRRLSLGPVGTASAFRLAIAADENGTGSVRILRRLDEAREGAGATLLPCCSQAGVDGEIRDFSCAQHLDIRVADTRHGCAAPPEGASGPFTVMWEEGYSFGLSTGAYSVARAADGGAVITGWLTDRAARALKADASGEVEWQRSIAPELPVTTFAVAAASDGGFILTGETHRVPDVQRQLYLVKLGGDGSVEWDKLIGAPGPFEVGRAVAETRDGGFAVAGSSSRELYLVRTDARGGLHFDRELGTGVGLAVAEDPGSGALVVAGEREGGATLLKTSALGEPLWERTIAPEAPYRAARLRDVLVTPEGDCLAVGSFRTLRGTVTIERAAMLMAAFSPDGTPLWRRVLKPRNWIGEAHSLGPTPDGGYLVAGLSKLFGSAEFYLVKLDPAGSLLWQSALGERRLGMTAAEVAVAGDGSAVIVGTSQVGSPGPWLLRIEPARTGQLPSDINQDGRLDLSDGLCLLRFLFGAGGRFLLPCGDGKSRNPANLALADGNQDGQIDISDAILIFAHLFLGRRPPALGKRCIAIEGCAGVCPP
jgi:outer membrane protein assembly factor BamB